MNQSISIYFSGRHKNTNPEEKKNNCTQAHYVSCTCVKWSKLQLKVDKLDSIASHLTAKQAANHMQHKSPYCVGEWLPSDQKVIDNWLGDLITEVKAKSNDKYQLLLVLHPAAEDEEKAMAEIKPAVTNATGKDLSLHQPVEDLKNAILSDPEINMFFH